MSDETLTISAILADIAPNGRSAGGLLGNTAAADDWPETRRESAGRKAKSISRNVEIGWSEPPSAQELALFCLMTGIRSRLQAATTNIPMR